jgi:glucose-fructose oxidoreductase
MPKQIGYAVVGTGDLTRHALLPAFATLENARLSAIVGADRADAQALAREFRAAAAYHLDEFRQCLTRDDVQAVYIAVPNSLHSDYTVDAARAGMHVLCERPMAVTADECRRMIRTCQTNHVKLMVSYRLRFQPAFGKVMELAGTGQLGTLKTLSSDITLRIPTPDDPRLQRRLGGGSVYDLGISVIAAARMLLGFDVAQVMAMTARTNRRYGGDVDESTVALARFPDERLAHFHSSFGEEPASTMTVFGEEGWLRVTPAYRHDVETRLYVCRQGRHEETSFEPTDQFAAELAYFSDCILNDRHPEPSGIDGLQDIRIVEAIYRSARDGRPVTLPRLARADAPGRAEPEVSKLDVAANRQAS